MRHLHALIALLLGALVLTAATTSTAAATTSTAAARTVTLAVTASGDVLEGDAVRLSGRLSRSPRGSLVHVQERRDGRWTTVARTRTRTTTAGGAWSRTLRARTAGRWRLRAVAPATRGLRAATSPVRTVRVIQAPPLPGTMRRLVDAGDRTVTSGDGRWLAVETDVPLLAEDTDSAADVYLVRQGTGQMTLVSAPAAGGQGDRPAVQPQLSDDATVVVFSTTSRLVPGDSDATPDVYAWDLSTGGLTLVSEVDGRSDGDSIEPDVSADGRWVAYSSNAADLVGNGSTNGQFQVFVRDLTRTDPGGTRLVSRSRMQDEFYPQLPSREPSVASSGSTVSVAYSSQAGLAPGLADSSSGPRALLWERDGAATSTSVVSVTADGDPSDVAVAGPDLAANGEVVVFTSVATDLVVDQEDEPQTEDVFLRDLRIDGPASTRLVSTADGSPTRASGKAYAPSVDGTGGRVAFNVARDDGTVQVLLWGTGSTTPVLVSRNRRGGAADGSSIDPSLTRYGSRVAFVSTASDLVAGPGPTSGVGVYVLTLPAL